MSVKSKSVKENGWIAVLDFNDSNVRLIHLPPKMDAQTYADEFIDGNCQWMKIAGPGNICIE